MIIHKNKTIKIVELSQHLTLDSKPLHVLFQRYDVKNFKKYSMAPFVTLVNYFRHRN